MPDNDFRINNQDIARTLTGKTAIVTGASRGIGRATAIALGRQGAKVCIMARGKESLEAVKNELESAQCQCFAQVADVCDPALVEEFIANCTREFDAPAILINNAGVYATEPLLGHSLQSWNTIINTNLTSAMWASRCVLPAMIERGWGRIVNVSSISGKQGEPYGSAYSAAKAGMIGMTQSVALEVARHGITVNAVCPGWVETKMAINQLTDESWCRMNEIPPEQSVDIARLSIPREQFVRPEEVAALICFLCGDGAASITGQALTICGGLSLH